MEVTPQQMQDKAKELQARMAPQIEQARATLSDFNSRFTQYARERPGTCILGAVALGYFIGKLASR